MGEEYSTIVCGGERKLPELLEMRKTDLFNPSDHSVNQLDRLRQNKSNIVLAFKWVFIYTSSSIKYIYYRNILSGSWKHHFKIPLHFLFFRDLGNHVKVKN